MSDIFDLLLTRDLSDGHILDFNVYAPQTDSLLFTYAGLGALLSSATREKFDQKDIDLSLPELRVIDSPTHPAVASNAPAYQHNCVPIEALELSEGRDIADFCDVLQDKIKRAMQDEDEAS